MKGTRRNMTTVATKMKSKLKQFMVTKPWPADEISTRNCFHCLAPRDGIYVRCQKKHPMVTVSGRNRHRVTYNGVVRLARLLDSCHGCVDFDNDWG